MKLIYKEKKENKRIIHILGIKFSYKKKEKVDYRNLYEVTKRQLEYLKEHSDITKLNPATGELRTFQLKLLDFCKNKLMIFLRITGNIFYALVLY